MEGKIRSISEAVSFAMNGDNDGYNYLYEKTWKNKYYVALKYMKNDEDAADVLQDAYMRAFQNLSMLNDPAKFEGWLGMIVANTAKNKLRAKNPVLFSEMDQDNGEGDIVEFQDLLVEERADFNPEERYSKVETAELVNELLGSLPEDQKICMIMFYLEGQSLEEIATALECSKNTVASRLNYGRKKIKAKGEELEKRGYKLYGVSPIVLLVLLLRAERHTSLYGAAAATTAAAGTTAAVSTAEGTAAAGSAVSGTAVGSTVGGVAGSTVGDLTAGELIDSIAAGQAGSVISGATAGGAATTAGTVVGATVAGGTVAGMVAGEVIDGVVAAQTGAAEAAAAEMGGAIAGEGAGSAVGTVAGESAQAGAGIVGSSISQSGAGAIGNMSAQAGASVQAGSAAGATNGATAGGAIGSGSAAGGSSSSSIAGKAVGETVKKGASGAAKKGFLSTVAGKTVAAIAGVAVVGGLVAGTIVLTNKDKDKDREELTTVVTEVVSTEDVTEIGSTDVTAEVVSSEEPTTEVAGNILSEDCQAVIDDISNNAMMNYQSDGFSLRMDYILIYGYDSVQYNTVLDDRRNRVYYKGYADSGIDNMYKKDDYTYVLTIHDAIDGYEAGEVEADGKDWDKYVYEEVAGKLNGTYYIYLPGTPKSQLPEEVLEQYEVFLALTVDRGEGVCLTVEDDQKEFFRFDDEKNEDVSIKYLVFNADTKMAFLIFDPENEEENTEESTESNTNTSSETATEVATEASSGEKYSDGPWKEAYVELINTFEAAHSDVGTSYNLIYVNDDDIPEIMLQYDYDTIQTGINGELYTFHDGQAVFLGKCAGEGKVSTNYYPRNNYIEAGGGSSDAGARWSSSVWRISETGDQIDEVSIVSAQYDVTKYHTVWDAGDDVLPYGEYYCWLYTKGTGYVKIDPESIRKQKEEYGQPSNLFGDMKYDDIMEILK